LNVRLKHQLAIIRDRGHYLLPGATILDFGCGAGEGVIAMREAGFDAYGCDVKLHDDEKNRAMREQGLLRQITMSPYRVPFADQHFDVLISNEVFEHVQNYDATIRETHRLLKPGGIALHLFPARWIPVEPHVKVPLASFFRPKWWLYLWALLGRRNPHQKNMTAHEVAMNNYDYLRTCTNYLPADAILSHFRAHFQDVRFVEDVFLRHATSSKARALYRLTNVFPFLRNLYSACWNRVVVTIK
jgi:SAM-dependent methyltransferase